MDKNGNLDRWKLDFLKTHKMVIEYLDREGMDPEGLGEPFNWVMDILGTASRHFKIEKFKIMGTKEEEPTKEERIRIKAEKELKRGEFAGYPYDESAAWGVGPEPEEQNPYHGTYSEE